MRQIHSFQNRERAQIFADYLSNQDVVCEVREGESDYGVWVWHDENLAFADQVLGEFLDDPHAEKFLQAKGSTAQKFEEFKKEQKESKRRYKTGAEVFQSSYIETNTGFVTKILIGICVFVAIMTFLGSKSDMNFWFYISEFEISNGYVYFPKIPTALSQFQIWRLVSPIFLHFGIMHIVFNMMWLNDLGTSIERIHGVLYYLILLVCIAIPSNLVQFFMSGPSFGGMSGVVYGFLGFLWIRNKFDSSYHAVIRKSDVTLMIAWYFLCLTGVIGSVANWVHSIGLLVGCLWGYFSSGHLMRILKRSN